VCYLYCIVVLVVIVRYFVSKIIAIYNPTVFLSHNVDPVDGGNIFL
jgi:hypothetical protein